MATPTYPASLAPTQCDPYIFDTAHFDNLLNQNSKRLFVPDDQLQIKVVEVGHRGTTAERCPNLALTKSRLDLYELDRYPSLP